MHLSCHYPISQDIWKDFMFPLEKKFACSVLISKVRICRIICRITTFNLKYSFAGTQQICLQTYCQREGFFFLFWSFWWSVFSQTWWQPVKNLPATRVHCIIERCLCRNRGCRYVARHSVGSPWAAVALHLNPTLQHPEYGLLVKQLALQSNHS